MQSQLEADVIRIIESMDEEDAPVAEPIETYHVYPVPGGMMILQEALQEPQRPVPHSTRAGILTLCFGVLLTLSAITFQLLLIAFPITAVVTIIPKEHSVTVQGTLSLVSGTPHAGELQGRRLPAMTLSQSAQAQATGKGHQDAVQAHGWITFYNGLFSAQTVPAGTVLTVAHAIQLMTDQDAVIPAGNPPAYGQVTVTAHARSAGAQGNVPPFTLNQACCLTSVLAKNTRAFIGGQDARDFTVVTQQDITSLATPLQASLRVSMQGALQAQVNGNEALLREACTMLITPDHQPGTEATTVHVTVRETCSGLVYDQTALQQHVTTTLSVAARQQVGTSYALLGAVQVTDVHLSAPMTLAFTAQGVWVYTLSQAEEERLKHHIAGKTMQEALGYLRAVPGIETVTIRGIEADQKLPTSVSNIRFVIIV